MPKLTIDGMEVEVPAGSTVMQACKAVGKEIPHFCYHPHLSIAANCRMCLVEVKPGPPKPQASCALPAAEGQVVSTNSEMVKKAREGVMELLLINHPLDCPICDQGGACDLQDQALSYGRGESRYQEPKRAVTDKYMGPIVKTVMTRCIQCTRCVRFAEEVAGCEDVGAIGRGESMQITTYLEQATTSELSGNLVDICPVGALTARPFAFEARPWELKKTPSIDVMDALGSNIIIESRSGIVMRILPQENDAVNNEWLSDKARWAVDGLTQKRLDRPYVRLKGKLVEASWKAAFNDIAKAAAKAGGAVAAIAGDMVDCETLFAARELVKALGGSAFEGRQTGLDYDTSALAAVNFNTGVAELAQADVVLLVGSDVRRESPVLNTRLMKAVRGGARVFGIGAPIDLGCKVEWLGDDLSLLTKLPVQADAALKAAARPVLILGGAGMAHTGAHGAALELTARYNLVREGWNGFNALHFSAARMGGLMLGYAHTGGIKALAATAPKLLFLLGADEVDYTAFEGVFKVYIGHHGDKGAAAADVVLPAAAYTEKAGTYVNLEGRVQRAAKAVPPPGDAREDWSILRALSEVLGHKLPFDDYAQLQAAMFAAHPQLAQLGRIDFGWQPPKLPAKPKAKLTRYAIGDYYLTNAICRASATMQRCSAELVQGVPYHDTMSGESVKAKKVKSI
jgi:NADH-quinone oxidoreductase subunit G